MRLLLSAILLSAILLTSGASPSTEFSIIPSLREITGLITGYTINSCPSYSSIQAYDSNGNGQIDNSEYFSAIDQLAAGIITQSDFEKIKRFHTNKCSSAEYNTGYAAPLTGYATQAGTKRKGEWCTPSSVSQCLAGLECKWSNSAYTYICQATTTTQPTQPKAPTTQQPQTPSQPTSTASTGSCPSATLLSAYDSNHNGILESSEFFRASDDWIAGRLSDASFQQLQNSYYNKCPKSSVGSTTTTTPTTTTSSCPQYSAVKAYDSNVDGLISSTEYFKAVDDYTAGRLSYSVLQQVQSYNKNNCKSATATTPTTTTNPTTSTSCPVQNLFNTFDVNKNGILENSEYFTAADSYTAGLISAQELQQLLNYRDGKCAKFTSGSTQPSTGTTTQTSTKRNGDWCTSTSQCLAGLECKWSSSAYTYVCQATTTTQPTQPQTPTTQQPQTPSQPTTSAGTCPSTSLINQYDSDRNGILDSSEIIKVTDDWLAQKISDTQLNQLQNYYYNKCSKSSAGSATQWTGTPTTGSTSTGSAATATQAQQNCPSESTVRQFDRNGDALIDELEYFTAVDKYTGGSLEYKDLERLGNYKDNKCTKFSKLSTQTTTQNQPETETPTTTQPATPGTTSQPAVKLKEGKICAHINDCETGLVCAMKAGVCVKLSQELRKENSTCVTGEAECYYEYTCFKSNSQKIGWCIKKGTATSSSGGGTSVTYCKYNYNCKSGSVCTLGVCKQSAEPVSCKITGDCPQGDFCKSGVCTKSNIDNIECKTNTECPSGFTCTSGTCQSIPTFCLTSNGCPSGYSCISNFCEKQCKLPTECPTKYLCDSGICKPRSTICGNGEKEVGEACDGTDLGDNTCNKNVYSIDKEKAYIGGVLKCSADCKGFDFTECVSTKDTLKFRVAFFKYPSSMSDNFFSSRAEESMNLLKKQFSGKNLDSFMLTGTGCNLNSETDTDTINSCLSKRGLSGIADKVIVIADSVKDDACGYSTTIGSKVAVLNLFSSGCVGLRSQLDSLLFHEFGHTLGLYHVDHEDFHKPPVGLLFSYLNCKDIPDSSCMGPNAADCKSPASEVSRDYMSYCIGTQNTYGKAAQKYIDELLSQYSSKTVKFNKISYISSGQTAELPINDIQPVSVITGKYNFETEKIKIDKIEAAMGYPELNVLNTVESSHIMKITGSENDVQTQISYYISLQKPHKHIINLDGSEKTEYQDVAEVPVTLRIPAQIGNVKQISLIESSQEKPLEIQSDSQNECSIKGISCGLFSTPCCSGLTCSGGFLGFGATCQ